MDGGALHERLRRARTACGEELSALSRRTGIRVHHLCAMEEGRFGDLPPGIYGRAAVRSFADAIGLDAAAVLAECDAQLPKAGDPIEALARKSGISRRPAAAPAVASCAEHQTCEWRLCSAAAIDAVVVGTLLMTVIALTAAVGRVPMHALGPAALPLAAVGMTLGSVYFVWFGGLCRITLGRAAVHASAQAVHHEALTVRTIAAGALLAATEDARLLVRLGLALRRGRVTPDAPSRNVPPRAHALWPLRLRGRAPALWLPAHPSASAPPPPLPPPRG